jgi:type I restriction enzyme M protein
LQSQFPEVLEEMEQMQTRLVELQALFAAADDEDFEDSDDTGVLPSSEVKNKKDDLKVATAEWKAQLKLVKDLANNLFVELKAANHLPKGEKKSFYCTEGFAQGDPQFVNGHRILELVNQVNHVSEYIFPLKDAIRAGQQAFDRANSIGTSLERHKLLEDEVRTLRATIKAIEGKRDELVQSARAKISIDEARLVIIERLRQTLLDIYQAYLRADQRACVKAIENLWGKYAVTAKTIEADRDEAAEQLQAFLVELGYE